MVPLLTGEDSLRRLFAALTEHTFQVELGVVDPALSDYLVDMLVRFTNSSEIYRHRSVEGERLEGVADMLEEAEQREARPERELRRHIGDFTLFWTGVYPENLRRIHRRKAKDDLIDYFDQGKRSYLIASNLSSANVAPPGEVLAELSDKFEYCVYGLGLVRQQWESKDRPAGGFDLFSN